MIELLLAVGGALFLFWDKISPFLKKRAANVEDLQSTLSWGRDDCNIERAAELAREFPKNSQERRLIVEDLMPKLFKKMLDEK